MAIFLIICMSTLMYRVAEREKRRGWLWSAMTTIVMLLLYQMNFATYATAIAGLLLMFVLMTLANIYRPVNKGPF
jgi:hypothetical protein